METHEPRPRDELLAGLWTMAMMVLLMFVAFLAAGFLFEPVKFAPRPRELLRLALFFVVVLSPAALLAWTRWRERRERRAQAVARTPATDRRLDARSSVGDCPFCHDALARVDLGEGVVRCPGCEVAHHAECWREHAGCSTLGCRRDPRQRDALRARAEG